MFNDPITKRHIRDSETHKYAAYQLAPRYYEWIRLHNGIMPGGMARCDLVLQKTNRHTFLMNSLRPIVRELTCHQTPERKLGACSYPHSCQWNRERYDRTGDKASTKAPRTYPSAPYRKESTGCASRQDVDPPASFF